MFGWFSKPKQENEFLQLLAFGNDQYATTIGEMFTGMDRGIRAHVLVAYENLLPVLSATYSVAQQRGDDFTIEHFIPQIVEKLEAAKGNEIATRRWSWFLFAAMLGRLEKISFTNALAKEIGIKTWCMIARDSCLLKSLLPNNVVWSDAEKEWFDLSVEDEKLIGFTINNVMPPQYSRSEDVKDLARQVGAFYLPSETRIGIIP